MLHSENVRGCDAIIARVLPRDCDSRGNRHTIQQTWLRGRSVRSTQEIMQVGLGEHIGAKGVQARDSIGEGQPRPLPIKTAMRRV